MSFKNTSISEPASVFQQSSTKKYIETMPIFLPSKLGQKKYIEMILTFRPTKLCRTKYIETTWIFRSLKFRRRKYIEMTSIFSPSKLHWKSMSKWRASSLLFSLRCTDVMPTSNRRWFSVMWPLGWLSLYGKMKSTNLKRLANLEQHLLVTCSLLWFFAEELVFI